MPTEKNKGTNRASPLLFSFLSSSASLSLPCSLSLSLSDGLSPCLPCQITAMFSIVSCRGTVFIVLCNCTQRALRAAELLFRRLCYSLTSLCCLSFINTSSIQVRRYPGAVRRVRRAATPRSQQHMKTTSKTSALTFWTPTLNKRNVAPARGMLSPAIATSPPPVTPRV